MMGFIYDYSEGEVVSGLACLERFCTTEVCTLGVEEEVASEITPEGGLPPLSIFQSDEATEWVGLCRAEASAYWEMPPAIHTPRTF